ncbi:hypothetical protein K435DRAFT_857840 [Dendrothele bispora CBS 962.96]|uniref:Uncharacterized protein n=1 Tax=Dendrothele bispora (strain CBS 962.96) TaxID=1314807 RepID=A0A4V4HG29_DENBC|nr:hypothetical protein K435DRAFT_857840 [Dendrothele bispora CBS 962.96]
MYDYFMASGKGYLLNPRSTPDYDPSLNPHLNSSERCNRTLPSSLLHSSASPPGPLQPRTLGSSPPRHQPETLSGHSTLQSHSNPLNATFPQPGSLVDSPQHQLEFPGHAASLQHQPTSLQCRPESLGPFSPLQRLGTHDPSEAAARRSSQPPELREVVEANQVESSSSEVVQAVSDLKKCLLQNAERDRAQREEDVNQIVTCLQEQTEEIKRLTDVLETQNGE